MKKPRSHRGWNSLVSAGLRLVGAPQSTRLAFVLPGLRVLSPAAPLHLSAGASPSLQCPTPPQPHWQSRFEDCQFLARLQHEHGTRHVLAATAPGSLITHSLLTQQTSPGTLTVSKPLPGGLGAWSCLRHTLPRIYIRVVRGSATPTCQAVVGKCRGQGVSCGAGQTQG